MGPFYSKIGPKKILGIQTENIKVTLVLTNSCKADVIYAQTSKFENNTPWRYSAA